MITAVKGYCNFKCTKRYPLQNTQFTHENRTMCKLIFSRAKQESEPGEMMMGRDFDPVPDSVGRYGIIEPFVSLPLYRSPIPPLYPPIIEDDPGTLSICQ